MALGSEVHDYVGGVSSEDFGDATGVANVGLLKREPWAVGHHAS